MNVPVVFIFFVREETSKKVFERIREARPQKLYLVSDGPRRENKNESERISRLRRMIENMIDWPVDVVKIYRESNMGCRTGIVEALNYVFSKEDRAIILEDDCLPMPSFFDYCEELLEKYATEEQVKMISGNNNLPNSLYMIPDDYVFSKEISTWGWATWSRVWNQYDQYIKTWPRIKDSKYFEKKGYQLNRYRYELKNAFDLVYEKKLDAWDYQFLYLIWITDGLGVVPKHNLVKNIGNDADAIHTSDGFSYHVELVYNENTTEVSTPLVYQKKGVCFDELYERMLNELYLKSFDLIYREKGVLIEQLRKELLINANYIIWGKGHDGLLVEKWLKQQGILSYRFCDSKYVKNKTDDEHIVYAPASLDVNWADYIIIGSRKNAVDIYSKIKDKGYSNDKIFLVDFLLQEVERTDMPIKNY